MGWLRLRICFALLTCTVPSDAAEDLERSSCGLSEAVEEDAYVPSCPEAPELFLLQTRKQIALPVAEHAIVHELRRHLALASEPPGSLEAQLARDVKAFNATATPSEVRAAGRLIDMLRSNPQRVLRDALWIVGNSTWSDDLFPEFEKGHELTWGTWQDWSLFFATLLVLFAVNQLATPDSNMTVRTPHWTPADLQPSEGNSGGGSVGKHLRIVGFWILIAAAYNLLVLTSRRSSVDAAYWLCGYLLEMMLSFDNLFIIYLVFKSMHTPPSLQPKGLKIGLLGAVAFRLVFYFTLGSLVVMFNMARIVFGGLLVYSGVQAVMQGDDEEEEFDPENNTATRAMKLLLGDRLDEQYRMDGSLWYYNSSGKCCVALLSLVIVVIEFADIVFACDSVSAKVAEVPDVYLNLTSTTLAMFCLRSLYFVMQDLIEAFSYLKYGLCVILIFVGVELAVSPWIEVPPALGLGFILAIMALCCIASAVAVAPSSALASVEEKGPAAGEVLPGK